MSEFIKGVYRALGKGKRVRVTEAHIKATATLIVTISVISIICLAAIISLSKGV